jgi:hypothetical protein
VRRAYIGIIIQSIGNVISAYPGADGFYGSLGQMLENLGTDLRSMDNVEERTLENRRAATLNRKQLTRMMLGKDRS